MAQLAALATSLTFAAPAIAAVDLAAPENAAKAVDNGWLNPIVNSLNFVLGNVESLYERIGVPDAYGWSIVSLTLIVKLLTFPLTKKQVESAMATQALKPRIDVIKERYGDDKKKVQKETSRLYEQAEVNPLAGCLPSLLQLPIFLGLYRSLNNVAMSGTLDDEGFLGIPSLAGPVSAAYRTGGGGSTDWLFPFVDGAPPIGWSEATPYLVLPVLLVLAQYGSSAVISPIDPNQEGARTQRVLLTVLPLAFSWIALTVPSGLSLYYLSNSVFTSALQIYFRKLGGATVDTPDLGPVKKLGMGRRTGPVVVPPRAAAALPSFGDSGGSLADEFGAPVGDSSAASMGAAMAATSSGNGAAAPAAAAANGASAAEATNGAAQAEQGDAQQSEEQGVMGGFEVDKTQMEGVAEDELKFLERRCKRRRQAVAS